MLPRERILRTFQHKPTDRVSIYHVGFSSQVASMILGRETYVGGGVQSWREAKALWEGKNAHEEFLEKSLKDAFDLAVVTQQDILRLWYWGSGKPTKKIDEYTFLYEDPEKNWYVMRFDPKTELYQMIDQSEKNKDIKHSIKIEGKALKNYYPDIQDEEFTQIKKAIEKFGKKYAIRVQGGGIGIPPEVKWLEAVALRPDLIKRYLDIQTERALRRIKILAKIGVKFSFNGGDDLASNKGPLYSPKSFHELMLPRLRKITSLCHSYGMYSLINSDGNLWPISEDLFGKSGIDGYLEVDREAGMSLERLREKYPSLVLIGNISSRTLHRGTKQEVIKETISCIEIAKERGGIIVGVSNYLMPGTPKENILAMMKTINAYR